MGTENILIIALEFDKSKKYANSLYIYNLYILQFIYFRLLLSKIILNQLIDMCVKMEILNYYNYYGDFFIKSQSDKKWKISIEKFVAF